MPVASNFRLAAPLLGSGVVLMLQQEPKKVVNDFVLHNFRLMVCMVGDASLPILPIWERSCSLLCAFFLHQQSCHWPLHLLWDIYPWHSICQMCSISTPLCTARACMVDEKSWTLQRLSQLGPMMNNLVKSHLVWSSAKTLGSQKCCNKSTWVGQEFPSQSLILADRMVTSFVHGSQNNLHIQDLSHRVHNKWLILVDVLLLGHSFFIRRVSESSLHGADRIDSWLVHTRFGSNRK